MAAVFETLQPWAIAATRWAGQLGLYLKGFGYVRNHRQPNVSGSG